MPRYVMDVVHARNDPGLLATLGAPLVLRYSSSTALQQGLPAFVRAASALRRWGDRRVIVQDDVLALAVLSSCTGTNPSRIEPLLLPPGPDGTRVFDTLRGNKEAKPDLEAALVLPDGRLVVFGSGANSLRELLFVARRDGSASRRPAADLYARLRADTRFSGSGLNLEGALLSGERIVLVQRGNAAHSEFDAPCNAMGELALDAFLAWLDEDAGFPPFLRVRRFDLGAIEGVSLGITDVCALPDGRIALLACAERSSGALTDGPLLGCRFGVLDADRLLATDILEDSGAPCRVKLEGIEHHAANRFEAVADIDDPTAPAVLATLQVDGLL